MKCEGQRFCFTGEGGVTNERDLSFTENIVGASNAYCYSEATPEVSKAKGHFKDDDDEVALSLVQT